MWIDQYADFIALFLHTNKILSPLLLLTVEEMGIPILVPGDAILAFVGSSVKSAGESVSLITATVVAVISVLVGSTILYVVARRWGRTIVKKIGRFIFLKEAQLEKAEGLFAKYGVLTIIFGRHIPGMRAPVTIFAAISGVKYSIFILSTLLSTIAWAIFWLTIGHHYGENIKGLIHKHTLPSVLVIVAIILLFIAFHFIGEYRESKALKNEATKEEK